MHDMVWKEGRSLIKIRLREASMLACPLSPPLPLPPLTTMAVTNCPCFSASRRMTSSKLKAGLPFVTELPKLKSIDSLESFR